MSDTNSQNNSDFLQTENKVSFWLSPKIYLVALSIILFYCISFGPLVFIVIKTEPHVINRDIEKKAKDALLFIYYPHFYVMSESRVYFNYFNWWHELAGVKRTMSYEKFSHLFKLNEKN